MPLGYVGAFATLVASDGAGPYSYHTHTSDTRVLVDGNGVLSINESATPMFGMLTVTLQVRDSAGDSPYASARSSSNEITLIEARPREDLVLYVYRPGVAVEYFATETSNRNLSVHLNPASFRDSSIKLSESDEHGVLNSARANLYNRILSSRPARLLELAKNSDGSVRTDEDGSVGGVDRKEGSGFVFGNFFVQSHVVGHGDGFAPRNRPVQTYGRDGTIHVLMDDGFTRGVEFEPVSGVREVNLTRSGGNAYLEIVPDETGGCAEVIMNVDYGNNVIPHRFYANVASDEIWGLQCYVQPESIDSFEVDEGVGTYEFDNGGRTFAADTELLAFTRVSGATGYRISLANPRGAIRLSQGVESNGRIPLLATDSFTDDGYLPANLRPQGLVDVVIYNTDDEEITRQPMQVLFERLPVGGVISDSPGRGTAEEPLLYYPEDGEHARRPFAQVTFQSNALGRNSSEFLDAIAVLESNDILSLENADNIAAVPKLRSDGAFAVDLFFIEPPEYGVTISPVVVVNEIEFAVTIAGPFKYTILVTLPHWNAPRTQVAVVNLGTYTPRVLEHITDTSVQRHVALPAASITVHVESRYIPLTASLLNAQDQAVSITLDNSATYSPGDKIGRIEASGGIPHYDFELADAITTPGRTVGVTTSEFTPEVKAPLFDVDSEGNVMIAQGFVDAVSASDAALTAAGEAPADSVEYYVLQVYVFDRAPRQLRQRQLRTFTIRRSKLSP